MQCPCLSGIERLPNWPLKTWKLPELKFNLILQQQTFLSLWTALEQTFVPRTLFEESFRMKT
jgi:hypothetical protein